MNRENSFKTQKNEFKKGDVIYPYKIDKDIKKIYEFLCKKEGEGYVASVLQYYCPDCKQFAGPYYETVNRIDELGTCPVCGRKIENSLMDFIVLYKVLKDFSLDKNTYTMYENYGYGEEYKNEQGNLI